jgi:nucleolar protein 56
VDIRPTAYGYGRDLLREACILLARTTIREAQAERSQRMGEVVGALEDYLKIQNLLLERLRGWYGFFSLDSVDDDALPSRVRTLAIGAKPLDAAEKEALTHLADALERVDAARTHLEEYINAAISHIAPNVSALVGPGIAARLVAQAGSIERLATFPAGTIQVLGAERALFRHLKDGTPPPKHGIIFQHELLNTAPKDKRGKLARLLATRIATAAKADAFTKNTIAEELLTDLRGKTAEILK